MVYAFRRISVAFLACAIIAAVSGPAMAQQTQSLNPAQNQYDHPVMPPRNAAAEQQSIDQLITQGLQTKRRASDDTDKQKNPLLLHQKDEALSYGALGGFAYQAIFLNGQTESIADMLDRIYAFDDIYIEGPEGLMVRPPVVIEKQASISVKSRTTAVITDVIFEMVEPASISSSPAHWRDYLKLTASTPATPHPAMIPDDKTTIAQWQAWVKEGWNSGVELANRHFSDALERLQNDFMGMVLYRRLIAEGKVTDLYLASSGLPVKNQQNGPLSSLAIGGTLVRISQDPRFTDPNDWQPIIIHRGPAKNYGQKRHLGTDDTNGQGRENSLDRPAVSYQPGQYLPHSPNRLTSKQAAPQKAIP